MLQLLCVGLLILCVFILSLVIMNHYYARLSYWQNRMIQMSISLTKSSPQRTHQARQFVHMNHEYGLSQLSVKLARFPTD